MPLVDETAPRDVIDSILKAQNQQMKLAGMLQGSSVSINLGKGGEGDSEDDINRAHEGRRSGARARRGVPARPVL